MKIIFLNSGAEKNTIVVALNEFSKNVLRDEKNYNLTDFERSQLSLLIHSTELVQDVDAIQLIDRDSIEFFLRVLLDFKKTLLNNIQSPVCEKHPLLKTYFEKRFKSVQTIIQNLIS
jgi:hypothetical protein